MKEKLTTEQVDGKMTFEEVIKYYFPNALEEMTNYILWERTCYPMDTQQTIDQIYDYYVSTRELV